MTSIDRPVDESSTDPADRGRLRIDRSVLRKIAEHAADSEADTAVVRRRIAGVGMGTHGASARIAGPQRQLRIRLDLALRYPAPIRATVHAVRERVRVELARAADCGIRSIDVHVSALVADSPSPRVE